MKRYEWEIRYASSHGEVRTIKLKAHGMSIESDMVLFWDGRWWFKRIIHAIHKNAFIRAFRQ